ncbi:unnamed protein product [Menidia menidia]|uniref:(Atlantic silverside) hypothetical protein n=1 Tax=Menidia menidia TaxID=238744 RepID=A0A8S4AYJ5_9TELE|nr:unnamed protein product [Menidia menidia]
MVHEDLASRLNDGEYKNWLKAGRCLVLLKHGLHPYADRQVRAFHGDLLNRHAPLRSPCLSAACRGCSAWQKEILKHHRQPDNTINWANCSPPLWRSDHWELAKAYMPRGQTKVRAADQCDASALLNLINHCTCFRSVDPKLARQIIQYRNELMHSCELRVKDDWMRHYRTALKHFVQQLSHEPEMSAAGRQIENMLSLDLSICISGVDQMDSPDLPIRLKGASGSQSETSAELVSQWEGELLQEMLQERLHAAAEDDVDHGAKSQGADQLIRLGDFLQTNADLSERFAAELQTISSLKPK